MQKPKRESGSSISETLSDVHMVLCDNYPPKRLVDLNSNLRVIVDFDFFILQRKRSLSSWNSNQLSTWADKLGYINSCIQ